MHTGIVYWMPFASANSVKQDLQQGDKMTTLASGYAATWHSYTANRCFTARAAVEKTGSGWRTYKRYAKHGVVFLPGD